MGQTHRHTHRHTHRIWVLLYKLFLQDLIATIYRLILERCKTHLFKCILYTVTRLASLDDSQCSSMEQFHSATSVFYSKNPITIKSRPTALYSDYHFHINLWRYSPVDAIGTNQLWMASWKKNVKRYVIDYCTQYLSIALIFPEWSTVVSTLEKCSKHLILISIMSWHKLVQKLSQWHVHVGHNDWSLLQMEFFKVYTIGKSPLSCQITTI